jgi:hypothetical protein
LIFFGSEQGPMVGSRENGEEASGSINCDKFSDYLGIYWLTKEEICLMELVLEVTNMSIAYWTRLQGPPCKPTRGFLLRLCLVPLSLGCLS